MQMLSSPAALASQLRAEKKLTTFPATLVELAAAVEGGALLRLPTEGSLDEMMRHAAAEQLRFQLYTERMEKALAEEDYAAADALEKTKDSTKTSARKVLDGLGRDCADVAALLRQEEKRLEAAKAQLLAKKDFAGLASSKPVLEAVRAVAAAIAAPCEAWVAEFGVRGLLQGVTCLGQSSTYTTGHMGKNVLDLASASAWYSATDKTTGQWLSFDLGRTDVVSDVGLTCYGQGYGPTSFALEISPDADFSSVACRSSEVQLLDDSKHRVYSVDLAVAGRYLRLHLPKNYGGVRSAVYYLELFSEKKKEEGLQRVKRAEEAVK